MKKYVIICGPVLIDHDAQILDLISEAERSFGQLTSKLILLPERENGAEQVRELIRKHIKWKYPTIVVTRYAHAIEEFAEAIEKGDIKANQVIIKLVEYAEGDMNKFYATDYHIMSNGGIESGWPFGILW